MISIFGLLIAASAPTSARAMIAPASACIVSKADYEANARLTFDEFDQAGTIASSARKLGERGCWKAAAKATADYLIHGPVAKPGEQRVLLFHLGQALAIGGEERRAADFIAATRTPSDAPPSDLNWNDYVIGTWAFLTKDRPALVKARDAVLATPGDRNKINGNLLAAMVRCFNKPYIVAYDPKCGR